MKRLILISDTHNKHNKMDVDLKLLASDEELNEKTYILHAGDCTDGGTKTEIEYFLNWFSMLPFKHKVFIAGNHDFGFEPKSNTPDIYPDIAEEFKERGVVYLMDRMVELDGLKIYGSPWQPYFYGWAFNVHRGDAIAKKWEKIPDGLDVLMTHGPVFGILDDTYSRMRVGCEELYKKVVMVRPKIFTSGHIHYARGYKEYDGINFFNAACVGENNQYQNKPIVVLLDDENNILDIEIE